MDVDASHAATATAVAGEVDGLRPMSRHHDVELAEVAQQVVDGVCTPQRSAT